MFLERHEIEHVYSELLLFVSKSFLFKYFCNVVHQLFWFSLIIMNLFLEEATDIHPLVQFEILLVRKVANK